MGCSGSTQRSKIISPHSIGKANIKYPTNAKLQIKVKDSTGRQTGVSVVSFNFTKPFLYSSDSLTNPLVSNISKCVLPGIDPRGEHPKVCQDICLYKSNNSKVLLILFDGHGKEGEKVVAACAKVADQFFDENSERYDEDPMKFLEDLCNTCDSNVKKSGNGIDSTSSGRYFLFSTAVVVFLYNNFIYSASLGDSRAILGTSLVPAELPVPKASNHDDSKHLYPNINNIFPVQLTKDQKPEDPDEYARILQHGGFIKRISENGKQIGPFRVFDSSGKYPGLAMSRSIGDASGSALGVISTPVCTSLGLTGKEKFIVIASDGVWDVMDNEDVVNFVEVYRKSCLIFGEPPAQVDCTNTIIAQLLCEEARMRWLQIITEEDVMIDDISCVILQFKED